MSGSGRISDFGEKGCQGGKNGKMAASNSKDGRNKSSEIGGVPPSDLIS
jgi:hypothetical protein